MNKTNYLGNFTYSWVYKVYNISPHIETFFYRCVYHYTNENTPSYNN